MVLFIVDKRKWCLADVRVNFQVGTTNLVTFSQCVCVRVARSSSDAAAMTVNVRAYHYASFSVATEIFLVYSWASDHV